MPRLLALQLEVDEQPVIRIFIARVLLAGAPSPCDCVTIPWADGVMSTADSAWLTCWPPAPPARKVSMHRSGRLHLDQPSIIGSTDRR
jgi:hypothetical protein